MVITAHSSESCSCVGRGSASASIGALWPSTVTAIGLQPRSEWDRDGGWLVERDVFPWGFRCPSGRWNWWNSNRSPRPNSYTTFRNSNTPDITHSANCWPRAGYIFLLDRCCCYIASGLTTRLSNVICASLLRKSLTISRKVSLLLNILLVELSARWFSWWYYWTKKL